MKVLGMPLLSEHLAGLGDSKSAETIRAWAFEIRYRAWANELELIAAFPSCAITISQKAP